ncbi:MAG TPA: Uma2 family endonuclease [Candidatus Tyrphobacter sp.]
MNAASKWVSMALPVQHHRFSLGEYEAMVEHGILTPDDRAELLAGEIVEKMTIGSRHAACVKKVNRFFSTALGSRVLVGVQDPVRLPPDSEPEPDVTLLKARDDLYARNHPNPDDVLLPVEISDSSLELDRKIKLPLYAAAGIAEVWIVDLTSNAIEIYTEPYEGRYARAHTARGDDAIVPRAFPGLVVRAAELLPQA